jgi:hypothetical protein
MFVHFLENLCFNTLKKTFSDGFVLHSDDEVGVDVVEHHARAAERQRARDREREKEREIGRVGWAKMNEMELERAKRLVTEEEGHRATIGVPKIASFGMRTRSVARTLKDRANHVRRCLHLYLQEFVIYISAHTHSLTHTQHTHTHTHTHT